MNEFPVDPKRVVGRLECSLLISDAVAAEREACAKIADAAGSAWDEKRNPADEIARAIRARGKEAPAVDLSVGAPLTSAECDWITARFGRGWAAAGTPENAAWVSAGRPRGGKEGA